MNETNPTPEVQSVLNMSSEELGLMLANLFEQGWKIQQDIHTITAELSRRKKDNDDAAVKG